MMDWSQIENDALFRTQRAFSSLSEHRSGLGDMSSNVNLHSIYDTSAQSEEIPVGYSPQRHSRRNVNGARDNELSNVENNIRDLRNVTILQGKKVLSIENVLSSYSGVFESSTEAQSSLMMRIDGIEQSLRGNNKFMSDASKERTTLSLHVRSLAGKVASLEDILQLSDRSYATKEAFSQLLDSTVDEIKSVSVAVNQAAVRSTKSLTLIETLIQAIHRMRGHQDAFSGEDIDAGSSLSFEFLSSLAGERQREQVVRLLGESLVNSVTSVARDVVSKEAESICNSVNSMLKTLNGQLMHSVDEVGKRTRVACTAADNKATQCLTSIARLEGKQFDIIRSVEDHADQTRDHVAKQLSDAMESIGQVLEDVASIQKTVKGDLNSFEGELSEQRKILYLELGVLKEGQSSVRNMVLSLERGQGVNSSALEEKVAELESEVRYLKSAMKADGLDNAGSDIPSNLTKEVITALVTEVILADTVDRRTRDLAAVAESIAEKQITHITAIGEESECRMAVQLQAMKNEFKSAEELLMKRFAMREADAAECKKTSCSEAEEWKSEMHKKMEDFQVKLSKNAEAQAATIQQLRVELGKKSEQLAQLLGANQLKNDQALAAAAALMEAKVADQKRAQPAAAGLALLQKEVAKMTSKVDELQTGLAKMSVQSMHLQEAVTAAASDGKDSKSQITQMTTTITDIQKSFTAKSSASPAMTPPLVSSEQLSRLEDRIEALSSTSAAKRDSDSSTENRVQTVATQHAKLAGELDALRASFAKAEKQHTQSTSQGNSAVKRMEASITAIEDGLDGLHGEVDQQAEQSSLLQKKLLLTEERVCKLESSGVSRLLPLNNVSPRLESGPVSSRSLGDSNSNIKDASVVRSDAAMKLDSHKSALERIPVTATAATGVSVSASKVITPVLSPRGLLGDKPIGAAGRESVKLPSTATATADAAEDREKESKDRVTSLTVTPMKETAMSVITGSESYSPSGDESSVDSCDPVVSPLRSPNIGPSPPGSAVRRRFQDATTAFSSSSSSSHPGKADTHLPSLKGVNPLPTIGSLSADKGMEVDGEDNSVSKEESSKKVSGKNIPNGLSINLDKYKDKGESRGYSGASSSALSTPSSATSGRARGLANGRFPTDNHEEDEHSSSEEEEEEDDEEDEDEDFPDDDSVSASEDSHMHRKTVNIRDNNNKFLAPTTAAAAAAAAAVAHSLDVHDFDESVDLTSSFDTSTSLPIVNAKGTGTGLGNGMGSGTGHSLSHFDPSDPTGSLGEMSSSQSPEVRGDRRSVLAPLNPTGRSSSSHNSSAAIILSSADSKGAPSTFQMGSADRSKSVGVSVSAASSSSSSSALSPPLSTIQKSNSSSNFSVGLTRGSPQPALSGSLLTADRKPIVTGNTLNGPSAQYKFGGGMGDDKRGLADGRYGMDRGSTHSNPKEAEEDREGNLDFDSSSWNDEDEDEDSS